MGQNSLSWARTMRERLAIDDPPDAIETEVVDAMVTRFEPEPRPLIAGATKTVRRLGETYPLGLASSAHPPVIAAALRASGLEDAFRAIAASDEVPHGKPSPDVFLLAAERLAVRPATLPRRRGLAQRHPRGTGGRHVRAARPEPGRPAGSRDRRGGRPRPRLRSSSSTRRHPRRDLEPTERPSASRPA